MTLLCGSPYPNWDLARHRGLHTSAPRRLWRQGPCSVMKDNRRVAQASDLACISDKVGCPILRRVPHPSRFSKGGEPRSPDGGGVGGALPPPEPPRHHPRGSSSDPR